jgi:hypothetical protein
LDRLTVLACLLFSLAGCTPAHGDPAPFSDWAAIVVAGDDRAAHSTQFTETFDNARHDIAAALVARGFASGNLREFSLRPERYPAANPDRSDPQRIYDDLRQLASRGRGGCLVYFTSHGTPAGVVVGDVLIPPASMARMIDSACGARPTVVIVSACFSGIFVPALAGRDRMILTASRQDRSSFGCGEADHYPFFDDCLLKVFPHAADFPALGPLARDCVAARERLEGASPPSDPQLWVGKSFHAPPFFGKERQHAGGLVR